MAPRRRGRIQESIAVIRTPTSDSFIYVCQCNGLMPQDVRGNIAKYGPRYNPFILSFIHVS